MSELIEKKISKSKEALLRSCVQMLSTQSWDEISIDDIEKYIHKTRGAIFHHYKTKDELFTSALIYLINSKPISCRNSNESVSIVIIRTLREDFKMDYPEKAFFNLITQAITKRINEISVLYKDISKEQINREEYILGKILLEVIINKKY